MTRNPRTPLGLMVGFGVLLVLASAVALLSPALVPTLGIAVVAASLFLDARATALVGIAAVALAALLITIGDLAYPWERLLNVFLASVLATTAAWTLDRWVRRTSELRTQEAAVLSATSSGLAVVDAQGVVHSSNPALRALGPIDDGAPLHPALGHVNADGVACTDPGCPLAVPDRAAVGGGWVTRAGERIPVEWTVTPLTSDRLLVTITDVSARLAAEQDRLAVARAAERHAEHGVGSFAIPRSLEGVSVDAATTGPTAWDVSATPDGDVLIVGAQAQGNRSLAPRDIWQVVFVARAYVSAGVALADLIRRVSLTVGESDADVPVCVVVITIDPLTGHTTMVAGAAAPVLVVRGSGAAQWLAAPGGPVGFRSAGSRGLTSTTLRVGDTLVVPGPGLFADEAEPEAVQVQGNAMALRERPLQGAAAEATAGLPDDPAPAALVARLTLDQ